ncbi:S-layer homology domain-containing protein [Thermophilibacter mediterraneus]|uniref:S-layer homology domain-containing protein n=1 Tax=Thermophilibacter mediterraneus TaxID=1871031 RepID=UPI003207EAA0
MSKFECGSVARFAAAAGLGLTLALGAAPVVAVAEGASGTAGGAEPVALDAASAEAVSSAQELKDAFVKGGSYKLSENVTLTEPLSIASDVRVNLDLNGRVIDGLDVSSVNYVISVEGVLTVQDSSVQVDSPVLSGEGEIEYKSGCMRGTNTVVYVAEGGSFTLEDGTLESTTSNPAVIKCVGNTDATTWESKSVSSQVNINGGVVKGYLFGVTVFGKGASLYVNGGIISAAAACVSGNGTVNDTTNYGGTHVSINGGLLFANDPKAPGDMKGCIYQPQSGKVDITGGRLLAKNGIGVLMRAGSLSVTGGSIESTGSGSGTFADSNTEVPVSGICLDYEANYPGATVATNEFSMRGGSVSSGADAEPLVKTKATNEGIISTEAVTGGSISGKLKNGQLPEGFVPEGYQMIQGGDGAWRPVVTNPVASINGTNYPSLVSAASAAESGDTITLLSNVESGRVDLPAGTTLDLNRMTLTFSDHEAKSEIGLFVGAGEVTVKNGTIVDARSLQKEGEENTTFGWNAIVVDGSGSVLKTEGLTVKGYAPKNTEGYNFLIRTQNGGDATLGKGTVLRDDMQRLKYEEDTWGVVGVAVIGVSGSGETQPADVAELTIDGADIKVSAFAVSGNGAAHGTDIKVNNGSIVSEQAQAIYHPQAGTLTVSGGTIEGVTGIEMRAGTLVVKDGATIKGGTGEFDYKPNASGSTTGNAAIVISQHTTGLPIHLDIQGGTFVATKAFAQVNPQINDEGSISEIELDISGGSFEGGLFSENFSSKDNAGFISGGDFSADPVDFVTANSAVRVNADGSFTAVERDGNLPAGTYKVPDAENHPLTKGDFKPGLNVTVNDDGTVVATRPYVPPVQSGEKVAVSETDGGKVSVTPTRADEGDEVTIAATPDEGQEVREVKVVDEDGNEVQVKAGEKDGEYVFTMPDGAVTVTVAFGCDGGELCPTHGFNDVDQSAWYHDAVDWAVENGVLNGYGEGGESLGPVADVTRAEMAQMLWNRAGRPGAEADLSGFTDVASDGWYAPALEWCVSEGIFSGYGDTFGTERTISREEAVTVLWRLSGSPEADADLSGYGDASSVSDYAAGAVEWAVAEGVLTGKGGVALDPQAGCTRGEVAAMMMRMAE